MPRAKEPKRAVEVLLDEEAVRDALALWVNKYHGIDIKINQITIESDSDGRVFAKFEKEPECQKKLMSSTQDSPSTSK